MPRELKPYLVTTTEFTINPPSPIENFLCEAESPQHAYEQARNAYPSHEIITVFKLIKTSYTKSDYTIHAHP